MKITITIDKPSGDFVVETKVCGFYAGYTVGTKEEVLRLVDRYLEGEGESDE